MKRTVIALAFLCCLFAFANICDDIAAEVAAINEEQDYLFSAYRDAQAEGNYEAMGDLTTDMGQNFYALETLQQASYDNNCNHCGAAR
ncbi:MAG: hypothetical protein QNK37_12795 [Acidobacteriota bacterium]|nr:hypothetical protein [Acidobacteriota bacterium]